MNARLQPARQVVAMTVAHLDAVIAIEDRAYDFPWTRGNFIDSIVAGYAARVLLDPAGSMLGYYVAMDGVDEMHLLNITVAPQAQRQGHAVFLLDHLVNLARERGAEQIWLEVRESNARARAIYERYGYGRVGLRRGYYPASTTTHANGREDAIVMSFDLRGARDSHEVPHALD